MEHIKVQSHSLPSLSNALLQRAVESTDSSKGYLYKLQQELQLTAQQKEQIRLLGLQDDENKIQNLITVCESLGNPYWSEYQNHWASYESFAGVFTQKQTNAYLTWAQRNKTPISTLQFFSTQSKKM